MSPSDEYFDKQIAEVMDVQSCPGSLLHRGLALKLCLLRLGKEMYNTFPLKLTQRMINQ